MFETLYIISFILITFLAVIGLVKLTEIFYNSIRNYQNKIIIVPVGGHVEDIEIFIRCLINKSRGAKFGLVESIIIADMGADEETAKICNNLENEYDFIYFCEGKEISEKLSEKLYI